VGLGVGIEVNVVGFSFFCCPLRAGPSAISFVPKGCRVCP
jgi:hypothetical protein